MLCALYSFYFSPCLDPDFDEPDIVADAELCRGLAAGTRGLHPDAWGNHDPHPLRHLLRRRREPDPGYSPPVDRKAELVWPPPAFKLPPTSEWTPAERLLPPSRQEGELQLTCDCCRRARYAETMPYTHGRRERSVAALRLRAKKYGWTCIVGTDRCPRCSELAPPEAVGNGAGAGQGDEQHADGC